MQVRVVESRLRFRIETVASGRLKRPPRERNRLGIKAPGPSHRNPQHTASETTGRATEKASRRALQWDAFGDSDAESISKLFQVSTSKLSLHRHGVRSEPSGSGSKAQDGRPA